MTKDHRSLGVPSRPSKAAVVVFSGEFDIACKEALRRELDQLAGVERLCLDLSNVEYIDSTAIGELIRLHKLRVERGYAIEAVVVGKNQPIRRLLKILHMESLFSIEENVPESYRASDDGIAHCQIVFGNGALQTIDKE